MVFMGDSVKFAHLKIIDFDLIADLLMSSIQRVMT